MKEELLHYVWKTKKLNLDNLTTTNGEPVCIQDFGFHNHNAGPDFMNGRVTIGTTQWAGHIEMHLKTSDWNQHHHQEDPAYNNVILHVVYENDKPIFNKNGQPLPTVVIKDRISVQYIRDYDRLISSLSWIPCANQIENLDQSKWPFFMERVLVNRLVKKEARIKETLTKTKNNWEEVLYKLIMRYFGLKVNGEAFETLSEVIPLATLKKQESLLQKESTLLGQAGMLTAKDTYTQKLAKEYLHQKIKYNLTPMTGVEWKFARLRPANFPSLRIAQLAALYHQTPQLFNKVINAPSLTELQALLDTRPSTYWESHYIPGRPSETIKIKKIGAATKKILIINAFIPLIFAYGQTLQNEAVKNKALDFLSELKPEQNAILKQWKSLGLPIQSAADSQALIELKTAYCDAFQCLNCQIGQQIVFS